MPKREIISEVESFKLPSGIAVEIQEIDAAAERLLTNRKEMSSGRALNKIMLSALVSLNNKPLPENEGEANALILDMKTGDRNYLLLRIRMQSYGDELIFNYECPHCHKISGYKINLREALDKGELKVYEYRKDTPIIIETRGGTAEIDYSTGRTEQFLAQQSEFDTVIMALAACKSFNGKPPVYKDFINLSVKDLAKIRLAYADLKGGLEPKIELDCLECDRSYDAPLYAITDFFIPVTTAESIGL